jgi:hypothetical protein
MENYPNQNWKWNPIFFVDVPLHNWIPTLKQGILKGEVSLYG